MLSTFTKKFQETISELLSSDDTGTINAVSAMFIRKYTHARIGGYIRGRQEKNAERFGHRGKGGAGLRDKLYVMTSCKGKK